jgi:glutamate racemase
VSTRAEVHQLPAPLLVPLVEEGWLEGEVPTLVVRRYLEPLVAAGIEALVLGCTHYPLLAPVIREEAARLAGRPIAVVDSAEATAIELAELLRDRDLACTGGAGGLSMMVTDLPGRFAEVAARFLGHDLAGLTVSAIDL